MRAALAELPAGAAIAAAAGRCAARGAQAQIRMHAAPLLGGAQLAEWARAQAKESELAWREYLAGAACSVLALHALIAAAADPRTSAADARAIEAAYLFTGAVVTLLDGVIDHAEDVEAGALSYAALFEDRATARARAGCGRTERGGAALGAAAQRSPPPDDTRRRDGVLVLGPGAPRTGHATGADRAARADSPARADARRLLAMRAWRAARARAAEQAHSARKRAIIGVIVRRLSDLRGH